MPRTADTHGRIPAQSLYESDFPLRVCQLAARLPSVAAPGSRRPATSAAVSFVRPLPLAPCFCAHLACHCQDAPTHGRFAFRVPPGRAPTMSGWLSQRQRWLRLVSRAQQSRGFARGAVSAPADRGKGAEVKGGGGEKKVGGLPGGWPLPGRSLALRLNARRATLCSELWSRTQWLSRSRAPSRWLRTGSVPRSTAEKRRAGTPRMRNAGLNASDTCHCRRAFACCRWRSTGPGRLGSGTRSSYSGQPSPPCRRS